MSNILDQSAETESQLNLNESNNVMPGDENEQKSEIKTPLDELQPSLDPGKTRSWTVLLILHIPLGLLFLYAIYSRVIFVKLLLISIFAIYDIFSRFCYFISLYFLVKRKMCYSNIF